MRLFHHSPPTTVNVPVNPLFESSIGLVVVLIGNVIRIWRVASDGVDELSLVCLFEEVFKLRDDTYSRLYPVQDSIWVKSARQRFQSI